MKGSAILIEASPGEVRGALIRNGAVWDVVHHRLSSPSLMGASYRGRVLPLFQRGLAQGKQAPAQLL